MEADNLVGLFNDMLVEATISYSPAITSISNNHFSS